MSLLDTSPFQPTTSPTTSPLLPRIARAADGPARGPFRVRTGLRAGDCYLQYPPGSNERFRTR